MHLRDILLISDSTFSTHASPAKGEGVLPPFLHISYSTKSVSLLSQMNTEATYLWRYEELLGVELNRTELNQIYKPKQQTGFEYKMKPLQAVLHLQVSLQLAMVFIYPRFQSSQDSHKDTMVIFNTLQLRYYANACKISRVVYSLWTWEKPLSNLWSTSRLCNNPTQQHLTKV
jgi:hypothetical protein